MVFLIQNALKERRRSTDLMPVVSAFMMCVIGVMCVVYLAKNYSLFSLTPETTDDFESWLRRSLFDSITADGISEHLKKLTAKPHVAGTEENLKVAQYIAEQWKTQGLEGVRLASYNVLLSYPDYAQPNTFTVYSTADYPVFTSQGVSKVVLPDQQGDRGAGVRWNAYSPSGVVKSSVIYCNYGTSDDFKLLQSNQIDVRGKIALIRYGHSFRGQKVLRAQEAGMIGVILYSDPADVAPQLNSVYPNTVWMPSNGAQRGTLKDLSGGGDPLTPNLPAKNWTHLDITIESLKQNGELPNIPVLPTSYADALEILSRLKGKEAPSTWQGGLNVTYHVGNDDLVKVRLTVNGQWQRRDIHNVIGFIRGSTHPDEYVIIGNHFDAWVYGSVDPNSGTAIMLEMSRAIREIMQTTVVNNDDPKLHWRPGRSILFCAWDAEEYGLIGSREFVEEMLPILADRAVVYLNVDNVNGNQTMKVKASPSLYNVMTAAAASVPHPYNPGSTVYRDWIHFYPTDTPWEPRYPQMYIPDAGSDQASFLQFAGVPSADFRYTNRSMNGDYPLYHTLYETVYLNEKLIDNLNYSIYRTVGRYWVELARRFADYNLLPLNVTDYACQLQVYARRLDKTVQQTVTLQDQAAVSGQVHEFLKMAHHLQHESVVFYRRLTKLERKDKTIDDLIVSMSAHYAAANKRLRAFEQCFVVVSTDGAASRHIVFGQSAQDSYHGIELPTVYEEIERYRQTSDADVRKRALKNIRREMSKLLTALNCARLMLNDLL